MSACAALPASPLFSAPAPLRGVISVERSVALVLSHVPGPQSVSERRRRSRHPFPYPVRVIPVSADGTPLVKESIHVVGKHFAARGLDFYSSQAIPYRRVVICFDCGRGLAVRLLMDLTWCRFCHHGWYENGGRFLRAVAPNLTSPAADESEV